MRRIYHYMSCDSAFRFLSVLVFDFDAEFILPDVPLDPWWGALFWGLVRIILLMVDELWKRFCGRKELRTSSA